LAQRNAIESPHQAAAQEEVRAFVGQAAANAQFQNHAVHRFPVHRRQHDVPAVGFEFSRRLHSGGEMFAEHLADSDCVLPGGAGFLCSGVDEVESYPRF
jgi:hypothetical protein